VKPLVTIGICVRNCEATINEAIESVRNQDFPHDLMEVIFVDDGSEDNTLSIIYDYISKIDMQARVFHIKWSGLGWARNVVARNAHGKYIIWVDGDMILSKDFVTKQVTFMEKNPTIGVAKGKYAMILESNLVADLETIYFVINDLKIYKKCKSLSIGYSGTGGSIYRLAALKQAGFFDPCFKGAGEDMDVEFRIKSKGWLLLKTDATFFEKRRKTWRDLWKEYFWQGFGACQFFYKYKNELSNAYLGLKGKIFSPIFMFTQIIDSVVAYRLARKKWVFLMPFHYVFKRVAWFFGYIKFYFSIKAHENKHNQRNSMH
jgi:glycosyltransferase involved in cell wall biosynthesis